MKGIPGGHRSRREKRKNWAVLFEPQKNTSDAARRLTHQKKNTCRLEGQVEKRFRGAASADMLRVLGRN